jgi:predicted TIM-barrel fold metal-dependent hydrolase
VTFVDGTPIIDCDVHHTWGTDEELLAYMSREWREFVRESGGGVRPNATTFPHIGGTNKRIESVGPNGEPPGSDYAVLREQLLDAYDVEAALLTYDIGHEPSHPNPFLSVELARAANDWTIDRWLDGSDDRLYGTIMSATQFPEEVAREIRRVGPHPRMAAVLLTVNGLGLPFGHPVYHPIYEAAVEVGLPISIHLGGETHRSTHYAASGFPNYRLELFTLGGAPLQHYVTSLITFGVFEKFPQLKVSIVESGLAWIPWLLWRLDSVYPTLRRESPFVRRLPSEYVREHLTFTTQPIELSPKRSGLMDLLRTVDGMEDMLLFASDYPHWDADDPTHVVKLLPPEWREKVLHENARRLFGFSPKAPETLVAGAPSGS